MNKYIVSTAATLALSLIGLHALAAWVQSPDRYVDIVESDANTSSPTGAGAVYVGFSSTPATSNCSNGNALWVIGGDADTIKSIQSIAVAAKLSRTHVQAIYNTGNSSTWTCSGGGTTGYPVLRGLSMRPST